MLTITLPKGDRCDVSNQTSTSPEYHQTIFEIICDPNIERLSIDNGPEIKRTNCINKVKMRSKQGKIQF